MEAVSLIENEILLDVQRRGDACIRERAHFSNTMASALLRLKWPIQNDLLMAESKGEKHCYRAPIFPHTYARFHAGQSNSSPPCVVNMY